MARFIARLPEIEAIKVGDLMKSPLTVIMDWLPVWATNLVSSDRLKVTPGGGFTFDGKPLLPTDYLVCSESGVITMQDGESFLKAWRAV